MRVLADCREPTVSDASEVTGTPTVRVGAVSYLNTRPLVYSLPAMAPEAEIEVDVPSRLADRLRQGLLDVATIPSIEYFRLPGATIVSDACVACNGPVQSVKVYGRKPVRRIETLALDEGSRTSVAMSLILLEDRFGVRPELRPLPIGASVEDSDADAVMLIGDRGMLAPPGDFAFVWDLGEEWSQWTGLPFVFSMWVARPGVDLFGLDTSLAAARDDGEKRLEEIARTDAPALGIAEDACLTYLRDRLVFHLGPRERLGLETFGRLAACHGLAPTGVPLRFYNGKPP
jgi:chorismate dehydratase